MTTPETEITMPWAIFRPPTIGANTMALRASRGVTSPLGYNLRLHQGMNTIMVTWAGYGGINIQLRDNTEFLYRSIRIERSEGREQRMVVVEAPVEDPIGHRLVLTGFSMDQDDVDKARAGVKIIPSSM